MTTKTTSIIHATVTAYEGPEWPACEHYPAFVADQLRRLYPQAAVEVYEGPRNTLFVDGVPDPDEAAEFGASYWDAWCNGGHKPYEVAARPRYTVTTSHGTTHDETNRRRAYRLAREVVADGDAMWAEVVDHRGFPLARWERSSEGSGRQAYRAAI